MTASGLLRVGVVCDFSEEQWPSMDLVGEMLVQSLPEASEGRWTPDLIRPPMKPLLSNLFSRALRPHCWNTDRLLNRFLVYPRVIRQLADRYPLFHVVDHSYSQVLHELVSAPAVVTCHDLDTFRCLLSPAADPRPRWFRAMAGRVLSGFRKARHVVCVSHTVREELLNTGWFAADKTSVIHNGVHSSCRAEPQPHVDLEIEQLTKLRPGQTMLLHVGSTIPRKRIDLLLRIFSAVRAKNSEVILVRVGGAFTAAQQGLADRLGVSQAIRVLPFLSRDQLSALYRRADLLLLPSDAEGFGLPLAEALACGCPVIASDLPVLREVGGSAAEFCPPGDIEKWESSVTRMLTVLTVAPEVRRRMRQQMVLAAERFSWTENARQSAAIYDEILSLPRYMHAGN